MNFLKLKTWFCATLIAIFVVNLSYDSSKGLAFISAEAEGNPVEFKNFGCSELLSKFKKEYRKIKYAAFAKGRAFTITGMLGCGAVWNRKTQASADKAAMDSCRKKARNPDKCYISHRTK
ncbi:MAG: hypothetical protein ABJL55_23440 [Roseibium sp.]